VGIYSTAGTDIKNVGTPGYITIEKWHSNKPSSPILLSH